MHKTNHKRKISDGEEGHIDTVITITGNNSSDGEGRNENESECDDDSDKDLEDIVFGGSGNLFEHVKADDAASAGFFIDTSPDTSSSAQAKPVWSDDDDDEVQVAPKSKKPRGLANLKYKSLANNDRKLEFEKTVGDSPSWAKLANAEGPLEEDGLLQKTYDYITKARTLDKGTIEINRCLDLNKQQISARRIEASEFHKFAQIALTASCDCRLNLFQVDGKNNAKIHSVFMEKFPIKCAHFLLSKEEIVMTSNLCYYYSYDLLSGKMVRVANMVKVDQPKVKSFKVSPDGKHLLFLSGYGQMHLVSSSTKELITTMKINGTVNDATFTKDGRQVFCVGDEGLVNIWDVRSQSCVHTFLDEGCLAGTSLALSPNGEYVACGSSSGIVNIYDNKCFTTENPQPIKAMKNLHTSVTGLCFNSTSEILAYSSDAADNAVKLLHVPSLTTFPNFPGFGNKTIRLARKMDFSPNSGYFLIGNHKGCALMYRLNHYSNY